jgi:hypothetical protein
MKKLSGNNWNGGNADENKTVFIRIAQEPESRQQLFVGRNHNVMAVTDVYAVYQFDSAGWGDGDEWLVDGFQPTAAVYPGKL